mgnify:FL=1
MSKPFSELRNKLFEDLGVLDLYICYDKKVRIGKDLSVVVENQKLDCEVQSLEEARLYAKKYIENQRLLEDIDTTVPEEKVANYIRKFHNVDKITDTLVESYIELASSNLFTIDPVLVEIKQRSTSIPGKIEHKLNDGSVMAISEDTQNLLNKLLEDKYQVVEYMRESKENFMRIIREVT